MLEALPCPLLRLLHYGNEPNSQVVQLVVKGVGKEALEFAPLKLCDLWGVG